MRINLCKPITRFLVLALCLTILFVPAQAAQNSDLDQSVHQTSSGLSSLGGRSGTLLSMGEDFPAGTSVCDWAAIALALSGSQEDFAQYLQHLQEYVEMYYDKEDGLDRIKSTPYHRIALTVLALGGDPQNFGTKSDGIAIDLIADGTYGFAGTSIGNQGLNGWIYALLVLDASGAEIPENSKFSREDMIQAIIGAQETDGGFGLVAGKSDIDITAMALQALAPYAPEYPGVIDESLAYLSDSMNENCLYTAYGDENAESSAQVILALCALGIDPDTDNRFRRGSNTILTGLEQFRREDGTYGHTKEDTEDNYLATAQVLLALTALQKFRSGRGWIFDFADYSGPNQKSQYGGIYYAVIGLAAVLIICIAIARKRKKYGKDN